ncbi:MAG: hypothetical protein HKK67_08670 [Chlorobiaceae bacterium]|nr:hypothetical protein [Chlorobiaceae bacterium]
MGLLDINYADPQTQGLLGIAQGLLAASAPSRMPVGIGQVIAQGLAGGQQGYQQGIQNQQQAIQMNMARQKMAFLNDLMNSGQQSSAQQPTGYDLMNYGQQSSAQQPTGYSANNEENSQEPAPFQSSALNPMSINPDYGMQLLQKIQPQQAQPDQPSSQGNSGGLASMPLDKLVGAISYGFLPKDALDAWKVANFGNAVREGSMIQNADGSISATPKVPEGMQYDPATRSYSWIPGYNTGKAATAALGKNLEAFNSVDPKTGMVVRNVPTDNNGQAYSPQTGSYTGTGYYSPSDTGSYSGNGAIVGLNPSSVAGNTEYQTNTAKSASNEYNAIQDNAISARTNIAKYQQIQQLLADQNGGKLAPDQYDIQSAAKSLGFNIGPGNIANKDAAKALATSMVPDLIKNAGITRMTDNEVSLFNQVTPSLANTPGGRNLIAQNAIALLNRQIQTANMARQWQQRFGRIDTPDSSGKGFQDYMNIWTQKNPIFQNQ